MRLFGFGRVARFSFFQKPANNRAVAIAAAVAIVLPVTASFEGLRTKPYKDVTGTPTVCYGETELPMRVYSSDECGQMLRARLAKDYAPRILDCVPALQSQHYVFGALLDASYNGGYQALCRSRMAKSVTLGKLVQACNGIPGYRETSKGKWLGGLHRRRMAEREVCLTNLLPGHTEQNLAARLKKWGVTLK